MKKYIFFFQFFLLSPSGYSQQLEWLPFKWVEEDMAVMNIPVTIDDLPYKFDMQFDCGAVTCLYGSSIEPYLKINKSLREKLDTVSSRFKNIHLHLGTAGFNGKDVFYVKDYEDVSSSGTIGIDLFHDKVLVIDYKNIQMAVSDSLPTEYKNIPYKKFELVGANRIKLPFWDNGREEWILFDASAGKTLKNLIISYITDFLQDLDTQRLSEETFFLIIDCKNKTFRVK